MKRNLFAICALTLTASLAACADSDGSGAGEDANSPSVQTAPSPEPAPFYVGQWAADRTWCSDQSEGFPVTITETAFEGREHICEMTDIEATPEGGATAQLSCQFEGMTSLEPIVFAQAGDQIAIVWPDRDEEATVFSRCE
ncbi:hypothetical protein [Pelagibacterium sp.]|uniref:hypothetical protein n=1 Tax=Pelagibacterium sp. TaxID=1967288 RepID=UPI003A936A9D